MLTQIGKTPGLIEESTQPFDTRPLIDQRGVFSRFEIVMNRPMFDYIVANRLYSKAGQQAFPGAAKFPCSTGAAEGAIMVKAAGWNFPIGDPWVTVNDLVNGTNNSKLNPIAPPGQAAPAAAPQRYGGARLAQTLNGLLTRQFSLGCLLEQNPSPNNRVTPDPVLTDGLGIPRPKIEYGFDEYTLNGFRTARATRSAIFRRMGATEFTDYSDQRDKPGYFELEGTAFKSFGAGHVIGTHRMGSDRTRSVVDADQHAHDHPNLWIVGSGSFPTEATPNPTLTVAALAFKTARSILAALGT